MKANGTVFIVDDDPGALRSLAYLLRSEGYSVETYASARAFLDFYDPDRTGCLVLDVRMAEMNGLQLQDELSSRGHHIPIIFVSGYGDVPVSVQAMKGGALDFLEKPVDDELLVTRVREAIAKDGARRHAEAADRHMKICIDRLTSREREVMKCMYEGKSTKVIAAELCISNQTAAKHRTRVLEKMEVDGEAQLARLLNGSLMLPNEGR